ncbi:MAG TPA: zf-HC2 domain-containing protein, partial [Thermoanaerobaculia bacterium]|nr:zf-HC2 domain-containing protein [Thermoanaerobaculia bacterium]
MDCARTRFFLNAYLDGELSEADRLDVAGHLARCERCSLRLESFRRIRSLLKDRTPRDCAPVELRKRIALRRGPARAWRRVWRPVVGATALCLLVIPVVADSLTRPAPGGGMLSEPPVERVVRGRFFCLRCALQSKLDVPELNGSPHLAAFRAEDGQVWILL